MKTILSIDPGKVNMGYGIIQQKAGKYRIIKRGMIKNTIQDLKAYNLKDTVLRFHKEIEDMIDKYAITEVSMERFVSRGLLGSLAEYICIMQGILSINPKIKVFNLVMAATWKNSFNKSYELNEFYKQAKKLKIQPHEIKMLDFMKELLLIEERKGDVGYEDVMKGGEIDTVIATLKGNRSREATKLAKKFDVIKSKLKTLTEEYDKANEAISAYAFDVFDARDAFAYRVVKTASITLSISKTTHPDQRPTKEVVDYKAVYEKIANLVDESLLPQIEAIIKEYTTITRSTIRKPSVKVEVNESLITDFIAKIKSIAKSIKSAITDWGKAYDKELKKLEADIDTITQI
jgi:hypothetical protein